jgi:hypothetical protein
MYSGVDPYKAEFLKRMGADLRRLREEAELSQEAVSDVIKDTKANRDRMSKVERGASGIELFDYLRLLWFYRDYDPQHPGVLLARRLLPLSARKGTGVAPR